MRLLVVNWQDRMNPHSGGAEIHLHEVFGRMAGWGHEITLLASGWRGAPAIDRIDGIEIHRSGSRHTFGAAAPLHYRRKLARRGFDGVVEALNKVPLFTPVWTRRPVALLVHHLFGTTAFREASAPVAAATWLLERPLPRVYRAVPTETISRSTAEDLKSRGLSGDRIRVIHPGVDLEYFTPDSSGRSEIPTFLYLGRLRRYKGIHLLISAMRLLRERGSPAMLLIGGRGEYEAELRRRARREGVEHSVSFLGFVSEAEKRSLFRSAWANVYPSPKEGWGITNIEAAACGTPSVASDSPGLRESVEHGKTGLLVPHGDIGALADALERLAGDRKEVERLGAGALTFARGFGWDACARATEMHLQSVFVPGEPART